MRLLVLFCCLWLPPGVSRRPSVGEIRVVSETWTRYTQEDGRGWPGTCCGPSTSRPGYACGSPTSPIPGRSAWSSRRGRRLGRRLPREVDEALYPRWPYDVDPIAVLSLKDNPPPPLEGLSRFRLSWMRGYAFARYFLTLTPHSELQRRTSALPMLLNHRVDYFIDSRPELEEMLAGAGALAAEYRITDVTRLPLYLGFSDSPGRELLALFDRRMRQLHASGELERIFARWNWPYAPLKAILPPRSDHAAAVRRPVFQRSRVVPLAAPQVFVVGLFPGAAVLNVDGQRKLVRVGQTDPQGVQVVSADSRKAVLRIDGVERTYELSREYNEAGYSAPQRQSFSIARGTGGHYWVAGSVNGRTCSSWWIPAPPASP